MLNSNGINGALNTIQNLRYSKNKDAYIAALQVFLYMMDFESEDYVKQVFEHYRLELMQVVKKLDGDTRFSSINDYLKNHNDPMLAVFSAFHDCPIMHKLLSAIEVDVKQSQKWGNIIDRTVRSTKNLGIDLQRLVVQTLLKDVRSNAKNEDVAYDSNNFYKRITLEFDDNSCIDIITDVDSTDIDAWFVS